MTKRKEKAIAPQAPAPTGIVISNCTIQNNAAEANEATMQAVCALAEASRWHAIALSDIASALKGGGAHMGAGIRVCENNE